MERVFTLFPASAKAFGAILTIMAILLIITILVGFTAYSLRNVKFELSYQALQIRGSLYGRVIPKESLDIENVRIINLKAEQKYQPRIRTNGIELPGYREGWFKLRNKEKALLFVTDYSNVVYIPTTMGYSVLLSPSQPEEFIKSMKTIIGK